MTVRLARANKDGKSPGKDAKGKGGKGNIPAGPVTADMLTSKKGTPLTVGELANKFAQLAKAKAAAPPPGAADTSAASPPQCLPTPPATHPLTQLNSTHTSANLRGRAAGKGDATVGGGGTRSPSVVSNASEKSVPGPNYACHACGQQGGPGGH